MKLGASQHPEELRRALDRVVALKPKVIVELGCDRGGTLYAWRQVCERVYGITLERNADSAGAACETHGAVVLLSDTHEAAALKWLEHSLDGAPVDVLVVDGDHHYRGVVADVRMYGPLVRPGGLILLHDVLPTRFAGVRVWQLWGQLHGKFATSEIGSVYGWGVIRVREGDDFSEVGEL